MLVQEVVSAYSPAAVAAAVSKLRRESDAEYRARLDAILERSERHDTDRCPPPEEDDQC